MGGQPPPPHPWINENYDFLCWVRPSPWTNVWLRPWTFVFHSKFLFGLVQFDLCLVWFGLVRFGLVWFGLVWFDCCLIYFSLHEDWIHNHQNLPTWSRDTDVEGGRPFPFFFLKKMSVNFSEKYFKKVTFDLNQMVNNLLPCF